MCDLFCPNVSNNLFFAPNRKIDRKNKTSNPILYGILYLPNHISHIRKTYYSYFVFSTRCISFNVDSKTLGFRVRRRNAICDYSTESPCSYFDFDFCRPRSAAREPPICKIDFRYYFTFWTLGYCVFRL